MKKHCKITLLFLVISLLYGCASTPLLVDGNLPANQPNFIKAYDGEPLPRDKTSMLVGAKFEKQTAIYIIGIDGKSLPGNKKLIGGPEAVVLLPGIHDIKIQFYDKGRIIIPLDLPGVTLDAGVGYLIDFSASFPSSFNGNFGQLSALRIDMMIVNIDTKSVVHQKTFNGWGKEVESSK